MQGLPKRTENRSNCQQSADDHRGQACPTASPRDGVHASNEIWMEFAAIFYGIIGENPVKAESW